MRFCRRHGIKTFSVCLLCLEDRRKAREGR